MAVYNQTAIPFGRDSGRGNIICSAWSVAPGPPLLAIATDTASVHVITDEGVPFDKTNDPVVKSSSGQNPRDLAWHSSRCLLAIGWEDGTLSFWSDKDKRVPEDKSVHKAGITCLEWNPEGTRLISGDEQGRVGVWKVDLRGRPLLVVQYHERGTRISDVVFNTTLAASSEEIDAALPPASPPFFYATLSPEIGGQIHVADDRNHSSVAYAVDGEIACMLFYPDRNGLIILTKAHTLTVHINLDDGSWTCAMKVKLSAAAAAMDHPPKLSAAWVGRHLLATASDQDSLVRVYDLESEANYVLTLSDNIASKGSDKTVCMAFNTRSGTLAVGTAAGAIVMWRYTGRRQDKSRTGGGPTEEPPGESCWQPLPPLELGSTVKRLIWGPNMRLLAATTQVGLGIVTKSMLQNRVRGSVAMLQLSSSKVVVENLDGSSLRAVTSDMQITGCDISASNLVCWAGSKAEVYAIGPKELSGVSSFSCKLQTMAVHRDSIYRLTGGMNVEICNLQGTVKQTLLFDEAMGRPTHLDVNGDFLAVATFNSYVKTWAIGGREAKTHGLSTGRKLEVQGAPLGEIDSIHINCNGSKISLLAASTAGRRTESRLFIYDADIDDVLVYDFKPDGRFPEIHFWDADDPRLLGVQTLRDRRPDEGGDGMALGAGEAEVQVYTLFATGAEHGVLFQDKVPLDADCETFLGLKVPHLYFQRKSTLSDIMNGAPSYLKRVAMRDFTGMEDVDEKTKKALLNLSYQLATGNMDEAYKAVKLIRNPAVWENMALMCIKTKRLDVAEHCLGNMGHKRGAEAVREAKAIPEPDARIASVAVQLGLVDEAERLYAQCERYDLLNELYQACGKWDKAVELATKHDRIHLKATQYALAKHREACGDSAGAIKAYEASGTQAYEVPRMLFEAGALAELEAYIGASGEPELTKWWARYCESTGDFDKALSCYQVAGDALSQVRVHCYRGNTDAALAVVNDTDNAAAAFHLARQFEAAEEVRAAIEYYSKARRFSHAVRLAKEQGMDKELQSLALQSTPRVMVEVGEYFESKGAAETAVRLYQRGGALGKAIEICFKAQLFESLHAITEDLKEDTDPALLARCGAFFMEHGQFSKAAHLFIIGRQVARALELCMENDILITEEMAEAMTPPKPADDDPRAVAERLGALQKLAKCCKRQGSYHLACKKYTQAGEKLKAMKVLLKSGDTEKIMFFANVSRQKEIYVLAANYLQSLDWHNDPEVMKAIITFYSKAKANESLATFYEACAQIEIDEYRDYEKALGALKESAKYLKAGVAGDRSAAMQNRIAMVESFVQARNLVKTNPGEMVEICNRLLAQTAHEPADAESSIRVGDVFALMIEYFYSTKDYGKAYSLIEKMKDRGIILSPYLDRTMVDTIFHAMGIEPEPEGEDNGIQDDTADGIGEELDNEDY